MKDRNSFKGRIFVELSMAIFKFNNMQKTNLTKNKITSGVVFLNSFIITDDL